MSFQDLSGQAITLIIHRIAPEGVGLGRSPWGSSVEEPLVWLPLEEMPARAREGDPIAVFVHHSPEGRLLVTRRAPRLFFGEVTFLEITGRTSFGAFADWGLPKDLLIPLAEQTGDLEVGSRHPIGLIRDSYGRLTGTQRVTEMLTVPQGLVQNDWVEGEAWRNQPGIGLFVIIQRHYVGRVPAAEPHSIARGETARFRVVQTLPDGKVELSLRAPAGIEVESDAERVLSVLRRPEVPQFGDDSSPEVLRDLFGMSKKAFKRAVGRLLKQRRVRINSQGHVELVAPRTGK